jgi:hypothetical protein
MDENWAMILFFFQFIICSKLSQCFTLNWRDFFTVFDLVVISRVCPTIPIIFPNFLLFIEFDDDNEDDDAADDEDDDDGDFFKTWFLIFFCRWRNGKVLMIPKFVQKVKYVKYFSEYEQSSAHFQFYI